MVSAFLDSISNGPYANKALITAQNLWIMGHSYRGIDPLLQWQVYYACCWSVMTYGMPLQTTYSWTCKNSECCITMDLRCLLYDPYPTSWTFCWYCTSLCSLGFSATHISTMPQSHPLCHLTTVTPMYSIHAMHCWHCKQPKSENVHLLWLLVKDFSPFTLSFPRKSHNWCFHYVHCKGYPISSLQVICLIHQLAYWMV